jgi:hypothetical protein
MTLLNAHIQFLVCSFCCRVVCSFVCIRNSRLMPGIAWWRSVSTTASREATYFYILPPTQTFLPETLQLT